MTFIACVMFMVFGGTANASTVTDPHYLTGSIYITNPTGSWRAEHEVNYNSLFSSLATCNIAKGQAESKAPVVLPAANAPNFGSFKKVSTLECVAK